MAQGRRVLGEPTLALARFGALVAVLLLAAGASWLQAGGRCISVEVDSPIVLPNKSIHEAGSLRLCLRKFSPTASLHETYVNGMPEGRLMSRDGTNEEEVEEFPYVVFRRNAADRLELIAYAWPDGDRMQTYLLSDSVEAIAALKRLSEPRRRPEKEEGVVLLAARAE
jgi:hypothetical protein